MFLPGIVENVLLWLVVAAVTCLARRYRDLLRKGAGGLKVRKNDLWLLPGPLSLPFVGTRWIYIWRYQRHKMHEAYQDMMQRYGGICREVLAGGHCLVSISRRADIEKVFRYPSRFPFRPPSQIIADYRRLRPDRFSSAGMANEQGEVWHNLRSKLTTDLTSPKTMLCFLPELNVIADDFLVLLRSNRTEDGYVKDFDKYSARYGLEANCTLVLGQRMTFMNNHISKTAQQLKDAMDQRFKAERDSAYFWRDYRKTEDYKKYLEGEEILYRIISDIVEKARNQKEGIDVDGVKCILMSVIEKPDLDEREKKSGLIDFVAAGMSTLGNSLIFLLYLIAKNPDVQQKVYEELEEIAPNSNHITATDLTRMSYTKACMSETFRLIPVAFALSRILEEDMILAGYHIPAGTCVISHTRVACQSEENFSNPLEFRPERWLNMNRESQSAATCIFAPFGIGKRMCPGKRFVEQGLLVTFAKMIREFHIEFDGDMDIQFEFILTARSPVSFRLRDRC